MKTRSCRLGLCIADGHGVYTAYGVWPLAGTDLGPEAVAGFRVRKTTATSAYFVRLRPDGSVSCTCPSFAGGTVPCKHAAALVALGLLPVRLVEYAASLRSLLDIAEGKLAECDILSKPASARVPRPRRRRSCKPVAA